LCLIFCEQMDCCPPGSCLWDSPGKNTGVGSHSLLQGIFLTQGSILGLLHGRQMLYHLCHQGSPLRSNYIGKSLKHSRFQFPYLKTRNNQFTLWGWYLNKTGGCNIPVRGTGTSETCKMCSAPLLPSLRTLYFHLVLFLQFYTSQSLC